MDSSDDRLEMIDRICDLFELNVAPDTSFVRADAQNLLSGLFARFKSSPWIYFSVGTGWLPLLHDLNSKLALLDPNYQITQIKEKFGGLRFYVSFSEINPLLETICYDVIHLIENKSFNVCEICGKYGSVDVNNAHYSTRCIIHKNSSSHF